MSTKGTAQPLTVPSLESGMERESAVHPSHFIPLHLIASHLTCPSHLIYPSYSSHSSHFIYSPHSSLSHPVASHLIHLSYPSHESYPIYPFHLPHPIPSHLSIPFNPFHPIPSHLSVCCPSPTQGLRRCPQNAVPCLQDTWQ